MNEEYGRQPCARDGCSNRVDLAHPESYVFHVSGKGRVALYCSWACHDADDPTQHGGGVSQSFGDDKREDER